MIKNNKKGFTLVELLAVIVILGVIASIGIFAINNTIKKSKEKSYQVTIKNVEAQASNYLTENSGKLFFISTDDGKEYQCVTIQDLIDFGYLKDNVTESFIADKTNVNKNDYIYLERDAVSKAITQSKYTFSDGEIINCTKAIEATADIAILVTHDGEWAKKKTVTIEYRLKDLYDVNELKNYLYGYTFSEQSEENNEALKKFDVSKNGTVTATIKYKDKTITKNKVIDRIDTTAPIISLGDYDAGVKARQATVNLVVTDTESGVNISSFTKDDLIIKIGDEVLSTDNYTLTYKNNGTYELKIQDDNHEGKVVIQVDNDKVFDKAENGNLETILEPNITFSSKYTITYDANGGSGAPSPTEYTYATSGTVTLSSQKPTRIEYTFLGWATSKTATTAEYAVGASYNKNNANNVTLYAVWKVNQVTIKYNANGGVMSANHGATFSLDGNSNVLKNNSVYTNVINYGSQLGTDGLLNYDNSSYLKVEKTGYNVPSGSEWNTKTDGTGTSYNQSTVYNASDFCNASNGNCEVMLYVNWKAKTVKITYDANGGTGAPSATEYTYATSGTVSLSSQKPTRMGYAFLGWSTSKTATTAEYSTGGNYNKNNANNVTLYAVWKVNQVTIKYNANGGVMSANHGATFSLDGNSNVLKNNSVYTNIINYGGKLGTDGLLNYDNSSYLKVEKTGYNVPSGSEWNTKTDGTGTSYNQSTVYNASDFCNASNGNCEVTLYVNWKAKTVKITYDANGGTGAPSATEYTYATSGTVSLSSQKPTRTGYAFLGWSTSKTATSATYTAGASYNKNNPNNVTLYAVWNINQIKITLDGNGATSGGTSSIYVENNSNVITPNSIVLPKRKYTITYNANNTEATMPPDTIVNYTLNGWYSAADGDSLIINNSSTPAFSSSTVSGYISDGKWVGTETKTLYAHWTDSHITLPYLSYNGHRCNWNTKADGTGEHYPMGATNFTTDKDITLYAICQHVCCHTGIGNCNNCRSDEISNGTGCYRTSGTNVNGTILENNICESLVTNKDTCGGYGWEDCNYTFTDCDQSCDDSGTPDPEPGGCRGSCDSGYHFDYNCKCVKDSSGSSGGGCFLAGTKVMTTMGLKDINKVKIGDMVLTYNEKRGINEYHLVTKKFYFKPNEIDESLYTLSIDDKTSLQVSSTHRFYIKRNNEFLWLRTKKMQVGDYIRYADGSYHKIINIHNEELTKPVYNLTVDDTHNFYVGEQLILVHNVNCGHFEGGRCRDSDYK